MAEFILSIGVWGVALTLGAFALGTWINKKPGQAIFHPLLLGSAFVIVFLSLAKIPLAEYQQSAQIISYLLLPATVSLAVPLYEQWMVLKKNALAVLCGILAGSLTSMLVIVAMGWALKLDPVLTTSLMPKSVTTAIGVPLSQIVGGMASVTPAAIILTGITASILGPWLCRLFRLTDDISRGVAFGTAGHVIGTAKANEMSQLTGAVSSLSLVVACVLTALVLPLVASFL